MTTIELLTEQLEESQTECSRLRATPLILEVKLRKWQALCWETMGTQNILLNHRSSGKTEFLAIVAAFSLYNAKVTLPIGVFAPSLKKARKSLVIRKNIRK